MKYIQKINSLSDLPIVRPLVVCDYDQRSVICKDKLKYLKFTSTGNSTISLQNNGDNQPNIEYSLDNGETWTLWDYESIELENGKSVLFRGNNPQGFSKSSGESGVYSNFVMTGSLAASGDVMTLINKEKKLVNLSGMTCCFYRLFSECTSLTTPPILSAKVLSPYCYYSMFLGCSNLTIAPALPAQTMTSGCYYNMFRECTKLTEIPILSSTKLADYCYGSMFYDCSSLTMTQQTLPATTLADNCYRWMFYGCSSLVNAPTLPATTLADSCYRWMFYGCSSLVNAPTLPATTLADSCYEYMFYSCSQLTSVPELPAMTLAFRCYKGMFSECTSLKIAQTILPATKLLGDPNYAGIAGHDMRWEDEIYGGVYAFMFFGCRNLEVAPVLPAKQLTTSCYHGMFYYCTKLTNTIILATDIQDHHVADYIDHLNDVVHEKIGPSANADASWLMKNTPTLWIDHSSHVSTRKWLIPQEAYAQWSQIDTHYTHLYYNEDLVILTQEEIDDIIEQYHIVYDD